MTMRKYFGPLMAAAELLIGTALTAAAFGLLIVPRGFAAGGVTGLSRILARIVPVPLPVVVFVVNMGLLLLGLVFVGRKFVAKTVSVSILFPAMLAFFSRYAPDSVAQNPMLCAIAAGVMISLFG